MRQSSLLIRSPVETVFTAPQEACFSCGGPLWICQHRERGIQLLDQGLDLTMRDKKCVNLACPTPRLRFRPLEESTLALPWSEFGLDVIMAIGSMRFRDGFSFPQTHARLRERGVPISPMNVQYLLRNYLSLVSCQVGLQDGKLRRRLIEQGAILPVIDGVQFGEGEPVLYLIVDVLSRQPLFGKQMLCRSADDLVPFIRQLKEIGVPIIAVVSDKEKALVPAIAEALPSVPNQFCQVHYIKNAAKPMEADLSFLGEEVRQTEEQLRKLQRSLMRRQNEAEKTGSAVPEDLEVTLELCEAARAEARRQTRAPFDPPALARHQGIERVAAAVSEATTCCRRRSIQSATARHAAPSMRSGPLRPAVERCSETLSVTSTPYSPGGGDHESDPI